jgi:hypothetical protein
MSKLLRGLVAGYGAKKLGGGCFSTVLIFLLLWWLPGYCDVISNSPWRAGPLRPRRASASTAIARRRALRLAPSRRSDRRPRCRRQRGAGFAATRVPEPA